MSGKFMKIKKLIIPTLTLAIMVSAMSGCSCSNQSELHKMIERGDSITIEVVEPDFEEQGTETTITWTELAKLTTYSEFRTAFENAFGITTEGALKNGVVYVDAEGNQTNNSTLYNAFMNKAFLDKWNNETVQNQLADGISTTYADLEDSDYTAAIINAYFNLLDDNQPNYFNGGASLSRAEAMTILMRAVTPVEDLKANDTFKSLVGESEYTAYASYMDGNCFINTSDKSISEQNFNGAMTRAEFVYMVMNQTFGKEVVSKFDVSKISLNDCKNAGDIATTEKFSGKDYCNSYVISQMVKNPDDGATTEIYKALAMAKEYGVISAETRWDEAITKTEAIDIITSAFEAYTNLNGSKVEADSGEAKDYTEQAKALYESNKSDWTCDEATFIEAYNNYINQGLTPEQVELQIEADYKKEKQEEQSKDNAVIESGDNEQLIPAGHEKYFYVQCGMRIGWNDSAKMGYEAGDYFYVANNGDIYYFSSEADKNSFDTSNPNKAFLFYVEGTGLVGGTTGEAHTTQPTESPTQQPTTQTQDNGNHTEESISTSEDDDWWNSSDGLHDPSQIIVNPDGGYDPNQQ